MEPETAQRLLEINRQFYQTFAVEFDATRQRLQPGVRQVLEKIPPGATILDLGCGNGELWRALDARGYAGAYVGLDLSPGLLAVARKTSTGKAPILVQADLAAPDWDAALPSLPPFDFILAFAVLHHLPGSRLRREVVRKIRRLLSPEGCLIHSNWQFLNSPRLRQRVQPWETAGISSEQVDPDDYLLDWRRGGSGLRYVHHFSPGELDLLAADTGFRLVDSFSSDGETGDLSLYEVWECIPGLGETKPLSLD